MQASSTPGPGRRAPPRSGWNAPTSAMSVGPLVGKSSGPQVVLRVLVDGVAIVVGPVASDRLGSVEVEEVGVRVVPVVAAAEGLVPCAARATGVERRSRGQRGPVALVCAVALGVELPLGKLG